MAVGFKTTFGREMLKERPLVMLDAAFGRTVVLALDDATPEEL